MTDRQPDSWQPCPPGTLRRLAGRWKSRERLKFASQAALLVVGISAVAIGGVFVVGDWSPSANPDAPYGGMSCREVREVLPRFVARELTPDRYERVNAHLMQCSECRQLMESMKGGMALHSERFDHSECATCKQYERMAPAEIKVAWSH